MTTKDLIIEINKIEKDADFHENAFIVSQEFRKLSEGLKNKALAEKMIWEHILFSFVTNTFLAKYMDPNRFYPSFGVYDLQDEAIPYLKERVKVCKSISMKARYSDFIWGRTKEREYALIAFESYNSLIDFYIEKKLYYRMVEAIDRMLYWGTIKIIDDSTFQALKKKVLTVIDDLVKSDKENYESFAIVQRLLNIVTKIGEKNLAQEEIDFLLDIYKYTIDSFQQAQGSLPPMQDTINYEFERSFNESLYTFSKSIKAEQTVKDCLLRDMNSFEKEAKEFEDVKNFTLASTFYRKALETAQRIGDKGKIAQYKKEVQTANTKSINEFAQISTPVTPHPQAIEYTQALFGLKTLKECLTILSQRKDLFLNYSQIYKYTETMATDTPLLLRLPVEVIDREGHSLTDGIKPFDYWLRKNFDMHMMHLSLLINTVMNYLKNDKSLDTETFTSIIEDWSVLEPNSIKLIKHGFQKYIEKDYVSATHILVPQLENTLRTLLRENGVDTVNFKRNSSSTDEATLEDLLYTKKDEVIAILGEDLYWHIRTNLIDSLSLGIRPKVGHGFVLYEECNETVCNIILHIYIALTNIKKDEKGS